jgi:hypothetical protein
MAPCAPLQRRSRPLPLLPLLLLLCLLAPLPCDAQPAPPAPAPSEAAARARALAGADAPPAPTPSATACARTWSLPYARRAALGAYPEPYDEAEGGGDVRLELFILHTVDPAVALAAVRSLTPSGASGGDGGALPLRVTLVDNSARRELSEGADGATATALAAWSRGRAAAERLLHVHTPDVPLDFQRAHNLVQQLAYGARLHAWYVMHSDATLSSGADALVPFAQALVRQRWRAHANASAAEPAVGLVFFNYDTLALFNPAATLAAGIWDVNFLTNYGADIDYYHRLRLAGFLAVDPHDAARLGGEASALALRVAAAHEVSHTLKSAGWACTRAMRMTHNFESEWRARYLKKKWGAHHNGTAAWQYERGSGSGSGFAGGGRAKLRPASFATPAPSGGWAYAGCFRDDARGDGSGVRALPHELPHVVTVAACGAAAAAAGYDVFGLQNGGECWACTGCAYDAHGRVPRQETCAPLGGPWKLQVYTRGAGQAADAASEEETAAAAR